VRLGEKEDLVRRMEEEIGRLVKENHTYVQLNSKLEDQLSTLTTKHIDHLGNYEDELELKHDLALNSQN
jgi:hypothetical protein